MKLSETVTLIPILHGKNVFTREVRDICLREKFDCIVVDIPEVFQMELSSAVEKLPQISAVIAQNDCSLVYYVPTDPCDAAIEGIRQGFQNHIPAFCIGNPVISPPQSLPPLPDEYTATQMGFDTFNTLCIQTIGNHEIGSDSDINGQYIANRLYSLSTQFKKILALVHFRNFTRTIYHYNREETHNITFQAPPSYDIISRVINPDHLYFALGELPFITGKIEKERYDPLAEPFDIIDAIKDLFRETRDEYFDQQDEITTLSPVRIQAALTFLRNLTLMSGQFIPSLMDIIESAKGVGGNSYAVRILKSAKYYPYFSIDTSGQVNIGTDKMSGPDWEHSRTAINLFRDFALLWRTISIKPDPSFEQNKKFRYSWNPFGMCSHVPEDQKIESFNSHVRQKALRVLTEDFVKNEKFCTSVKDGIDIRETLRNWYTGDIYVKELPPSRGKIDTVIIIFDENHDAKYPHYATWYAEHPEESTLSFYATDPFSNMIGPGIARCFYGGLSLLFPPRSIPNLFEITEDLNLPNLSSRLTYGSMLFSREKNVAYVSSKKPSAQAKQWASKLNKHLVWIPLTTFSNETLRKLSRFHILNGKTVRSWASRFIGD